MQVPGHTCESSLLFSPEDNSPEAPCRPLVTALLLPWVSGDTSICSSSHTGSLSGRGEGLRNGQGSGSFLRDPQAAHFFILDGKDEKHRKGQSPYSSESYNVAKAYTWISAFKMKRLKFDSLAACSD